jgi:hypothetical protein
MCRPKVSREGLAKSKTLAVQEFILPKKEKQNELISLFKQFDTTIEQLKQQR